MRRAALQASVNLPTTRYPPALPALRAPSKTLAAHPQARGSQIFKLPSARI